MRRLVPASPVVADAPKKSPKRLTAGMPPLQVVRGKDGHLRINDGVTRATRAAQLQPGVLVPAEVIQELPQLDVARMPKVKDTLP